MTIPISMSFIETSEDSVLREGHGSLTVAGDLIRRSGDVLLGSMYALGPQGPVDSPEGIYRAVAFERVGEVPYTLRAIELLRVRGHYPEAVSLARVLVESFVQLRYFARFPDQLKPHLLAKGSKGRVPWRTMFDAFALGFYDTVYSLLCGVAHSGMALSALLPYEEPTGDQPGKTLGRYGCAFDERQAALVTNLTVAVLRGFLAHFLTFFPEATPPEKIQAYRSRLIPLLDDFVHKTIRGEWLSMFVALTS